MKKAVLISIHVEDSPVAFPLAAAVLKTAVESSPLTPDWRVELLEFCKPCSPAEIAESPALAGADACGFSIYSWNADIALEAARLIREKIPAVTVFAGGPQVTAVPAVFENSGHFDFIITGEGEEAVPAGLAGLDKAESEVAADIFSSAKSPYPAAGDLRKRRNLLWEVSRGCPYNCAFCYESRGCSEIRTISEQRMSDELKLFKKNRIEKIWVLDPTFNHNSGHAETVLKKIERLNPGSHYTFEIRAELMSEKLCRLLSGLDASLQIGLQSSSKDVLKTVNRSLNPEKFRQRCRMMSEYGLTFGIDLIYGLPNDNISKFRQSVDFAVEAGPNNIDIFPLAVLPGTELAEKAGDYGIKHCGFPTYVISSSGSFSKAELKKAAAITAGCDNLYNREQAFPWFRTVTAALDTGAAALFESYAESGWSGDSIDFLEKEFKKAGKADLFPPIESFILWSRAAEAAFGSPGTEFRVRLCRKPEVLDQLAEMKVETFLRRNPASRYKTYKILFDGEELYID